tara:strand:- start:1819 stop:3369 length:1551 start_codon:yes stop_codon:yes gene_type:complete
MSLFEKLNNKRYNLQEKPSDDVVNPEFKDPKKKFTQVDNLDKKELNKAKKTFKKDLKSSGEKPSSSIKSALDAKSGTKSKGSTPVKINVRNFEPPVKKSVDARVITKKYNEKNPNRPEYVKPQEYKAAHTKTQISNPGQQRPLGQLVKKTKPSTTAKSGKLTPGQIDFSKAGELAAKRKARIDTKTGKATQAGVFDFAKNRGGFTRMSQGMSKSDFKKMITSDPKKASQFKNIVSKAKTIASDPSSKEYKKIADNINKSDYAGKLAKPDAKIAKMTDAQKKSNLAKVKAKIDAKNPTYISPETGGRLPVKTKTTLVRSKEISKQLNVPKGFKRVPITKKMGEKYPLIKKRVEFLKPPEVLTTPPKPKSKNLFSRVKNLMTTIGQKTKDFRTRPGDIPGNPKWDQFITKSGNFSRRNFSRIRNIPGSGTLKKQFFKRIVGASPMTKTIGGLALTAYALSGPTKKALAPKTAPDTYTAVNKSLGFDTGKKNADKIAYKKFMDGTTAFKSPVKKTYKKT